MTVDTNKDSVINNKSPETDNSSLVNSNIATNLEKINVTDRLSSCSLYAIDVTTE